MVVEWMALLPILRSTVVCGVAGAETGLFAKVLLPSFQTEGLH